MTPQWWQVTAACTAVVLTSFGILAAIAVAWGRINQKLEDLWADVREVKSDVKRINGSVSRHEEAIASLKEGV